MAGTTLGVIRAEGVAVNSLETTDKFVIQRLGYAVPSQYAPLEATVGEILGGYTTLKAGTATLAAGTATVALTSIAANSLVLLTPNSSSPNALGVVITAGTGFVIHSSSGTDTSVVSYIVLGA